MDSLANYGSDDEYDDSPDERSTDWRQSDYSKKPTQRTSFSERQADANYEEVQMDLSEESNDGVRHNKETAEKHEARDGRRFRESPNTSRGRDDYRNKRRDRRSSERSRSGERRNSRDDDRRKDDRRGSNSDRYGRDEKNSKWDTSRDSYRDKKYRRSTSRDRKGSPPATREKRRSSSRERRRSNSRDRRRSGSRDRKRSSSRERRRSRSPKRDRYRRSRSRSRSRGRYSGASQKRYGYPKTNGPRTNPVGNSTENPTADNNRFFMPGITGKYRDQIEKRKLLWQKKEPQKPSAVPVSPQVRAPPSTSTSRVTKIWEGTTFAQDQDGKVASKFKRLMGIKGQSESAPGAPTDIIKKQEEMFSSMEQQYEVARTATHTMRGVGLGFSSNYTR